MSQAETEESSQSLLYNPDFLAIIGQQPLRTHKWSKLTRNNFLGGVVCFWGGIALLGVLFMLALMVKNYLVNNIYNIHPSCKVLLTHCKKKKNLERKKCTAQSAKI